MRTGHKIYIAVMILVGVIFIAGIVSVISSRKEPSYTTTINGINATFIMEE